MSPSVLRNAIPITEPSRRITNLTSARRPELASAGLKRSAIWRTMLFRYPGNGKSIPSVWTVATSVPLPPIGPPPARGAGSGGVASAGLSTGVDRSAAFLGVTFAVGTAGFFRHRGLWRCRDRWRRRRSSGLWLHSPDRSRSRRGGDDIYLIYRRQRFGLCLPGSRQNTSASQRCVDARTKFPSALSAASSLRSPSVPPSRATFPAPALQRVRRREYRWPASPRARAQLRRMERLHQHEGKRRRARGPLQARETSREIPKR